MLNLFLVLIIIFSLICVMTVIVGSKSSKKIFPIVSAICSVFVIALAFGCMIETEQNNADASATKAYISVTETKENKTEETQTTSTANDELKSTQKSENSDNDPDRIVYITRSGAKYHYSYNCSDTDFYECTLEEALERGLEPCSKCVE